MKKFIQENGYLIVLWILCIATLFFFTGHYANILSDVGREIYYPERILEGKVLYKDLFVIYGPLAYQWNAWLYKIFGIKLQTLYASGVMCAFAIVNAIYFIAKRFLSKFLSFSIGVFAICTGVCATHLFNFTFPYSWAMLYGTGLSLYSFLFLIKFKDTENTKWLYWSALLSGGAIAYKYDFVLYSFVVLGVVILTKNVKIILKSFLCFVVLPFLSFGILFLQGLRLNDLVETSKILNAMVHTYSLDYFYTHSGVYFSIPILIYWIVNFIKAAIGAKLITAGMEYTEKSHEISIILLILGAFAAYFMTNPAIFSFLIGLTVVFAIFRFRQIKNAKLLSLLILTALALSLKSMWGLTPFNYGNYYCAIVLTAFCAIWMINADKKIQTGAGIYILIVSLWFGIFNAKTLPALNYKIETPHGTVYTMPQQGVAVNELVEFLNEKAGKNIVTVFPEGLIVNFLSENSRMSDDFYNSLLPLYVETFGEENIINHFSSHKPDFIIFSNQSMSDYNSGYICRDYAKDFCGFVNRYYHAAASFGSEFGFFVFQKNT